MRQSFINARWPLLLPEHRAEFHTERPWWEAARLVDMWSWLDYERDLKGTPKIVDVGSEEGDLTALYASWGADVAFIDPSRPWRDQTLDTFTANGLDLPVSFTGFCDTYNYIEGKPVEEARFADIDEQRIARIRLDTFCEWFDFKPDAVVIDVEGSEHRVIEGAGELLDRDIVWWVSLHGKVDPHAQMPSTFHETMRRHGFKDQWLGHQHEWFYRFWRP